MQKSILLIVAIFITTLTCFAQNGRPLADYRLVEGRTVVQTKNYYLLTLFQEIGEVSNLLKTDAVLSKVGKSKLDHLSQALVNCGNQASCYTGNMKFSEAEIKAIGERLATLYTTRKELANLVRDHLVPSGVYIRYSKASPRELLVKAWEQDARGVNFAIGVYAEGQKPFYPKIDSISFDIHKAKAFGELVYAASEAVLDESKKAALFFEPSLTYALRFLEISGRNEAADFEPMATTVNKAACERIKSIKWEAYPYTLILVPGSGPQEPGVAISPIGMLRCRTAALRYFEGKAPFIMVSGGRVHPYKTQYSEAYEMKKYLMETMRVPENAIILEPHARHTTTNMRNCARLIFRYGMPFDQPCITSTTRSQSFYITDKVEARSQQELLHVPFRKGKRLSNTEAEFYPVLEALHANPFEPLDP